MIQVDGVRLGRWSDRELERRLERASTADLNFMGAGSTVGRAPVIDRGGNFEWSIEAPGTIEAAAAALRAWRAHEGISARILPTGAPLVEGTTVLVVAPFGPVEMAVANRIVAVIDEPDRFGFVYASLEGHAEAGEELFLAEAIESGRLRLSVRVHAGPASIAARAVAPLVRLLSRKAGERYLASWADAIVTG